MKIPTLSIVMPVFNREKYVKYSIQSILSQTFSDFEFIIVNDGSNDRTEEIIKGFKDKRIILINNENNKGIVFSRNKGLAITRGKYIGMFDSDDIAYPNKFEEQINYLDKNPDIAMLGAWVKHIDENGKLLKSKWKLKAKSEFIPAIMLFRNYFVQSTVVIRKEAIPVNAYSEGYKIAEDSKMWFEVSLKYKVANIQKYLLDYRVHSGGVTNMKSDEKIKYSDKLFRYIFSYLEIKPTKEELSFHYLIKNQKKITTLDELIGIEKWLLKIANQNKIVKIYDQKIHKKVLLNRWLKSCYKAKSLHIEMILLFLKSKLTQYLFS